MRESVRYDVTARLLLKAIVTDRRRRLHRCFDVAGFQRLPALIRVIRPDARKTVSLQFNAHLKSVRLDFAAGRALRVLNLRQDAQQILHVMTDLMSPSPILSSAIRDAFV